MINLIVAISKNKVIGNKGTLPWNIPQDMAYFKKITQNSILILGKNTFLEINKPLKNRYIIVISNSMNFSDKNLETVHSFKSALSRAKKIIQKNIYKQIFICGGQKVYYEGIKYADTLYITQINKFYPGNRFFIKNYKDEFKLFSKKTIYHTDSNDSVNIHNLIYKRINSTDFSVKN